MPFPVSAGHMYVITGPEGAGKTTLLGALARRGVDTVPESTRDVWRYQARIGGRSIAFLESTLQEKLTYYEMSLALDMRMYDNALDKKKIVLFDRGMPDLAMFMQHFGTPVPPHIDRAIRMHPYNRLVFLAPFWEGIYANDPERTSSPEQAAAQEAVCQGVYASYGYSTVRLPLASPEQRADFVLQCIAADQIGQMLH